MGSRAPPTLFPSPCFGAGRGGPVAGAEVRQCATARFRPAKQPRQYNAECLVCRVCDCDVRFVYLVSCVAMSDDATVLFERGARYGVDGSEACRCCKACEHSVGKAAAQMMTDV